MYISGTVVFQLKVILGPTRPISNQLDFVPTLKQDYWALINLNSGFKLAEKECDQDRHSD